MQFLWWGPWPGPCGFKCPQWLQHCPREQSLQWVGELRNGKQGSFLFPLFPSLPLRSGSPASIWWAGSCSWLLQTLEGEGRMTFPIWISISPGNTEAVFSRAALESDPRPLLCIVKVKREALLPSDSGFVIRPSVLAQYFLIFSFHLLLLPCLSGAFLTSASLPQAV